MKQKPPFDKFQPSLAKGGRVRFHFAYGRRCPPDEGNLNVVSGWTKIFILLRGEYVQGDDVALCVSMLACLGGRNFRHLAWMSLDHHVTAFTKLTCLLRVRVCGTGVG